MPLQSGKGDASICDVCVYFSSETMMLTICQQAFYAGRSGVGIVVDFGNRGMLG